MSTVFVKAFLGWAAAITAPESSSPDNLVEFRVSAVAVDEAVMEFRTVCLNDFPNLAAFREAVNASSWNYAAVERESAPLRHEWRSARGIATFNEAGELRGAALPQCNFDTAVEQPIGVSELIPLLESTLDRSLGFVPSRLAEGELVGWRWPIEGPLTAKLLILRWPGQDARQLSLSVQLWDTRIEPRLLELIEDRERQDEQRRRGEGPSPDGQPNE